MQDSKGMYTTREEVEELLIKTRDLAEGKGRSSIKKERKKLSPRKLISGLVYSLLLLALIGMLGKVWIARLTGQVPELFGYQMYVVETGSMIPNLPIGSTIIVRTLDSDMQPAVGEIITYSRGAAVITHRITEEVMGEDGVLRYQTRGDNPDNAADPWLVSREDIRGTVIWHFMLPWEKR